MKTLREKADELLATREDLYEYHFHKVDREWLLDAMVDFAENNKNKKSSVSNNMIVFLMCLVITQLVLFSMSFYYYFHNEVKLAFLLEGICYTYCMAALFLLLKYKNQK